jgi:hypothetical protein
MTHDEARELFTARIDDALAADERARLERHLAGCADCRRELERLERTVALLHQARPVHAPAGFVERVAAAVRPAPPRRRLVHALFRPLPVKLPLHAAALVLVAITATWLLRTPHEAGRAALAPATPASEPSTAPPPPQGRSERSDTAGPRAEQEARLRAKEARPAAPSPASPERRVTSTTRADTADGVVVAAWNAPDRAAAVRELEALVMGAGGTTLSRREDPDVAIVEVWLPDGGWAAVARELERRGRLRVEREPAGPGSVRATLRISG